MTESTPQTEPQISDEAVLVSAKALHHDEMYWFCTPRKSDDEIEACWNNDPVIYPETGQR